jgi:hypothetical protein
MDLLGEMSSEMQRMYACKIGVLMLCIDVSILYDDGETFSSRRKLRFSEVSQRTSARPKGQ